MGTCLELENVVNMGKARDVTGVKLVQICSPLQKLTGKWKGLDAAIYRVTAASRFIFQR